MPNTLVTVFVYRKHPSQTIRTVSILSFQLFKVHNIDLPFSMQTFTSSCISTIIFQLHLAYLIRILLRSQAVNPK